MLGRDIRSIICNILPNDGANPVGDAEQLVKQEAETGKFDFVDAGEYNPVLSQKFLQEGEAGIHPTKPFIMTR